MPIRHIVLFKIRPSASSAHIDSWKQQLESMKSKVQGVLELRVAKQTAVTSNYQDRSGGFQYILDGTYQDAKALEEYTVHPDHRAAQAYSTEHLKADDPQPVVAVDYEY